MTNYLFDPTGFRIHFKALLLEIQKKTGKSLAEVYQTVNEKMHRVLRPSWGPIRAWSPGPSSLRSYAHKNRSRPMDQQQLEAFLFAYLDFVDTINYENIISLYAANGLIVNKAYIDSMAQLIKDSKTGDGNFNVNIWRREYPNIVDGEKDPLLLQKVFRSNLVKRSYRYLKSFGFHDFEEIIEEIIEFNKKDNNNLAFTYNPHLFLHDTGNIANLIAKLRLHINIPSKDEFHPKIISDTPSLSSFVFQALTYIISSMDEENVIVLPVHDFLLHDISTLVHLESFYLYKVVHRSLLYYLPESQDSDVKLLTENIVERLLSGSAVAILQMKANTVDDRSLFVVPKVIICMTRSA